MPIYEYQCIRCRGRFEALLRSFTQADAADGDVGCPHCGAAEVTRRVTAAALGGTAQVGPGRAAYPFSWEHTGSGDPGAVDYWRRRIEKESKQEEKDPELTLRRHETARRRWQEQHGGDAGPAEADGHGHGHGWDSVPFVVPGAGRAAAPSGHRHSHGHTHGGGQPPG